MWWMGSRLLGTMIAALLALGANAAQAKPTVRLAERLSATAAAPAAKGRARLVLKSDEDGRLRIAVRGLAARTAYDVVLGGVSVAAVPTNGGGNGRVRLSTDPKGSDARLGVDPRGLTVVIRDPAGNDVLAGAIEDGTDDPTQVACCLPDHEDDDEQTAADESDGANNDGEHGDGACADLTPEQCGAEGGTVMTADSCIPNPCDENDDEEIVCCLPGSSVLGAFVDGDHDDDGDHGDDGDGDGDDGQCHVGCEDTTPAECAEAGGTVVDAESCEPNPCSPVPPTDVVACCLTEDGDDDVECETVSAVTCEALGGQVTDASSCQADPCD